jgi:hypothetical protein
MTTAWSLVMHGRFADAARAHASGTLLAIAALVAGLAALGVAARRRRPAWVPGERAVAGAAVALATLVLVEWMIRLLA